MKNQKLRLNSIKVKSFVTKVDKAAEKTVKGGGGYTEAPMQTWEMNGGDCFKWYTTECHTANCTATQG